MRFLTLLASILLPAIPDKVISPKAIHTEAMITNGEQFLLMRKCLKLRTGIKWILFLANDTLTDVDISSEGIDRWVSWGFVSPWVRVGCL